MIDQKSKFSQKGIARVFVSEAQDNLAIIKNVLQGESTASYYWSGSHHNNERYRIMLLSGSYRMYLVAVAVDEAHCEDMAS